MSTSVITVGVDINSNHFQAVLGIYTHPVITAQQFIQACHRTRNFSQIMLFIPDDHIAMQPRLCELVDKDPITAHRKGNDYELTDSIVTKVRMTQGQDLITREMFFSYVNLYHDAMLKVPRGYIDYYMNEMGYKEV